jgi:hypothetical protein
VTELHDLDIDIEGDVRCAIVQRQDTVDPFDPAHEAEQFGLSPHRDFARNSPQRLGEADELECIAEPVIATHQHPGIVQRLATPDVLQVPGTFMLGRAARNASCEVMIVELPRTLKIARAHGRDPPGLGISGVHAG